MYQVLNKDMIELEIVLYLPETKRRFKPQVFLCEIVNVLLHFKIVLVIVVDGVKMMFENFVGYNFCKTINRI